MAITRPQLKKMKEVKFSPQWDLNHGPLELKASVLPMRYTDPEFPRLNSQELPYCFTIHPRPRPVIVLTNNS